jgi:phosphopantothenoylcysteine decarboxylase/phosphopantothenate--cysteine ligase
MSHSKHKILFMMSGSIAAFKACQVVSQLVKEGHEVQVVATPSTFEFVGAMTLEGLTGKKVLSGLWEAGHAMDHIHLTRWADYAVLCPASANTLAKLAGGFSEDLVSAMALAWPPQKKFWIFPAMNLQMLAAPVTQNNLQTLRARGFTVAPTQSGALACGEEGPGRMLEADEILRLITLENHLGRILVTGGATREPIDGIRFISNVSTGQTASAICDDLSARGWQVTYLHGLGSQMPTRTCEAVSFTSFSDLEAKLRQELSRHDFSAVIHCAAVSDYSVAGADSAVKMKTHNELNLKLKANPKLLPKLKEYSRNKNIRVIGFKLTLNANEEDTLNSAREILSSEVDAIVANDWSQVNADRQRHPGALVREGAKPETFSDLNELNLQLHNFIRPAKGGENDSLS